MQSHLAAFTWRSDADVVLNFWVWLLRTGELPQATLIDYIRRWTLADPFDRYRHAAAHRRWPEYLPIGSSWHDGEAARQLEASHGETPSDRRANYRALKAIGVELHVQWVMAPFRQRWLLPPNLAVLGAEGASDEDRRAAVLDAARALRQAE